MAYVTTASMELDHPRHEFRRERLEKHIKNMSGQGIKVTEVDIIRMLYSGRTLIPTKQTFKFNRFKIVAI